MRRGLAARLREPTTDGGAAAKRRQLVAWSRTLDGSLKECGIMRVDGRTAKLTGFTFLPDGDMETESGEVIRADVGDVSMTFVSDAPIVVDGSTLSGSRWRGPQNLYIFVAWDPAEHPNQEGEMMFTDQTFSEVEDRWPVTSSFWLI